MAIVYGANGKAVTVQISEEQERQYKAWRDRQPGYAWHGVAQAKMNLNGYAERPAYLDAAGEEE
jgi:hypothetical protein